MSSCSIRQVRTCIQDLDSFLNQIREIAGKRNTRIIFFDACRMAGMAHVESALVHALRAWKEGTMISSRIEMEALLFASGSRQIMHASAFGVHPGKNAAYLCLCPDVGEAWNDLLAFCDAADDEDWETLTQQKTDCLCQLFSITPQELGVAGTGRLKELVLERVALLEVYR